MMLRLSLCACLLLAPAASFAAAQAQQDAKAEAKPAVEPSEAAKPAESKPAKSDASKAAGKSGKSGKAEGDMQLSGMSILGNDEAPKELVIVPWKSSQLGDAPGISRLLDDATQPVDKDVFLRELAYYGLKPDAAEDQPDDK